MKNNTLLVIGAAGDVGQGIVEAALQSGRKVVISGRDESRLLALAQRFQGELPGWVIGDISTEAGARDLWARATKNHGNIHDVVVSVNAPNELKLLMEWSSQDLAALLSSNTLVHLVAAKVFLPVLPEDGLLIGIGGGTADFIFPKMAHVSMAQAAQRMLYKGLAKERSSGADIKELMIAAMVAGHGNRDRAGEDWISNIDVGRHLCAILDAPGNFPDTVLRLQAGDEVGRPQGLSRR